MSQGEDYTMAGSALRLVFTVASTCPIFMAPMVSAQETKKASAKPKIEKRLPEVEYRLDVFSGNEMRFAAMTNMRADCSSGPVPDTRIVANPTNGEIRSEQIRYIVSRSSSDSRAHCNGKEVDAIGLYYKSREGFVGEDKITVDVDYKIGTVRRYHYVIQVR
jgi:hypothetical protein